MPGAGSRVTGSISPRPIAAKRSPIMPRSMLAMLPLTASASVGASVENPGGSSSCAAALAASRSGSWISASVAACCDWTLSVSNRPRPAVPGWGTVAAALVRGTRGCKAICRCVVCAAQGSATVRGRSTWVKPVRSAFSW
jgi:hypothetical protein